MSLPTTAQPLFSHGWARAILFFAVYITLSLVTGMLVAVYWTPSETDAIDFYTKDSTDFNNGINQYYIVIQSIVCITLALLFRIILDKQPVKDMGFSWRGYQWQAWGGFLLAGLLLVAGAAFLYFAGILRWVPGEHFLSELLFVCGLLSLAAIQEEIVFRGYILNNLLQSMNPWMALALSAVLFTLAHSSNPGADILGFINVFLGGLVLGINYVHTRNLWFSVFFHIGWNVLQGPVLGFPVSGITTTGLWRLEFYQPGLLTGGAFGFESSLTATLLLMIALWAGSRRRWWKL